MYASELLCGFAKKLGNFWCSQTKNIIFTPHPHRLTDAVAMSSPLLGTHNLIKAAYCCWIHEVSDRAIHSNFAVLSTNTLSQSTVNPNRFSFARISLL